MTAEEYAAMQAARAAGPATFVEGWAQGVAWLRGRLKWQRDMDRGTATLPPQVEWRADGAGGP